MPERHASVGSSVVSTGPLKGIRALDFGVAAAGPVSLMYLAMLGADVIKIESPRGDHVRWTLPRIAGMGATFLGNNLGKRGIVLDLKDPGDLNRAHALVKTADVVVDNFRDKTVMRRLGLGYTVMRRINRRIVYVQSSGYGRSRVHAGMFSNEWLAQASSGFAASTGPKHGERELSRGTAYLDWFAALTNVQAILIGLSHRQRTGTGLMIETSQYSAAICAGFTRIVEALAGVSVEPFGSERQSVVPELVVRTADGEIAISAPTDAVWRRLCRQLGYSNWLGLSNGQRVVRRRAIHEAIAASASTQTTKALARQLDQARIPNATFTTTGSISDLLMSNRQVSAQHLLYSLRGPQATLTVSAPPWRFSRTPAVIRGPSPELGEHQRAVLDQMK